MVRWSKRNKYIRGRLFHYIIFLDSTEVNLNKTRVPRFFGLSSTVLVQVLFERQSQQDSETSEIMLVGNSKNAKAVFLFCIGPVLRWGQLRTASSSP